jgi:catechol 2,3-dioxygenase-like lactoylglutathione lyase family enzyme
MSISAMMAVTVGVSHLEAALRLFRDAMGLRVERDETLAPDLAAFWGVAPTRTVELSYAGYAVGRLRLLAVDARAQKVRDD